MTLIRTTNECDRFRQEERCNLWWLHYYAVIFSTDLAWSMTEVVSRYGEPVGVEADLKSDKRGWLWRSSASG